MENNLQIFNNKNFGQVRVLNVNGTIYFVGKDVAENLGYADTDQAIREHVDDEDKALFKPADLTGLKIPNRGLFCISESGLYSLILSSKLPKAKEFKHWITAEVLPSIRKTGSYSISQPMQGDEVAMIGRLAENIQTLFAVRRGIALSQAIELVSVNNKLNLDALKVMLPSADHDTGFVNNPPPVEAGA